MKNILDTIIYSVGIFLAGILVGAACMYQPQQGPELLSPVELQQILGVEPDGRIGPKTMAAWEKALRARP